MPKKLYYDCIVKPHAKFVLDAVNNTGIVDVSHRYDKMYVVRPQFFIPLITLLVKASRKSIL